jgi:hypothetical protein
MQTRSQTKYDNSAIYEVNIDFDGASEAWKANKKSIGNGSYKYICAKRGKNNNCCIRKCLHGEDYCKTHFKMFNEGKIKKLLCNILS